MFVYHDEMKPQKMPWMFLFISTAMALSTAACKKKADTPNQSAFSSPEQRLNWALKTLVDPYEHAGYANSRWDEPAKSALHEFARLQARLITKDEPWLSIIRTNVTAAMQAGCEDPMIQYLFVKYSLSQTNSKETFTKAFSEAAMKMQQSSYPAIRKFYSTFRTVEQFAWANNYPSNYPPEMEEISNNMRNNFTAVIEDNSTPPEEIYSVCHEMLEMWKGDKTAYQSFYKGLIEPAVFKNWPNAASSYFLKGEANIEMAWQERGGGYAGTVSKEGWASFERYLEEAEKALTKAWSLNPGDARIAVKMMWVELGQGTGRDRMELWFNRAMAVDPDNYDACNTKLLYIEPKWYGSAREMVEFGRACVQHESWGGRIPTILVNAHLDISRQLDPSEQTNYWKRPEVWADIQSAYDRCFQIDPQASDLYYYYARFAYRAEDRDKLNELIPKLGPIIDYDFFGGRAEFDKMLQFAEKEVTARN